MDQLKTCSKCKRRLCIKCFYSKKENRDGRNSQCKDCVNLSVSRYRDANPEKIKELGRRGAARYRVNNPERAKAAEAKYRSLNVEMLRAKRAVWRENNPGWWKKYQKKRPRLYLKQSVEEIRASNIKNLRRLRVELLDSYVAKLLLQGIPFLSQSDIPPAIIEAKRAQLKLHRLIKERQK